MTLFSVFRIMLDISPLFEKSPRSSALAHPPPGTETRSERLRPGPEIFTNDSRRTPERL